MRVLAADTIIFLDYPRWLCLIRALRRDLLWRTGKKQPLGGNPGKIDGWFLRSVWLYRTVERPQVMELLQLHTKSKQIYIFTSPRQVEDLF